MNLVFGMLSTLLTVTTPYDGIWNVGTSIPRGLCEGAIGYHNNSIYLLGGAGTSYHRSLLVYDLMINNFTDYGEFYLPLSDKISYRQEASSFYTQLDHYLYTIDSNSLFRFDLKNNSYDHNWNDIPFYVYNDGSDIDKGCLASTTNLIFLISRYQVNALNLSSMSWLSNMSSMIESRSEIACIVHPIRKRLYAIPGWIPSIESLYIGDDQDITTQTWALLQGSFLDISRRWDAGSRAVVYGDDIWVIGGYTPYKSCGYKKECYAFTPKIAIIDTLTEEVRFGGSLYSAYGISPIVVNDFMYVFGGCDYHYTSSDTLRRATAMRYADLLATREPTSTPTTGAPTVATGEPTGPPTDVPTTALPTDAPTTAAPTTGTPTDAPTTATPTEATDTPTTYAPTEGTSAPTTATPTTAVPTSSPITGAPTTGAPTSSPITAIPTTATPTGTPTSTTPIVSTMYGNSESYEQSGSVFSKQGNMRMMTLLCIAAVFVNFN
eukprot:316296_1